ncbi:Crp/Fnr family transcriptional regulator [Micromonospora sp. STR1s_5]|nr:Crp/Fnr family transcriptional regulator [Micromonospora sp. STR1s_5]
MGISFRIGHAGIRRQPVSEWPELAGSMASVTPSEVGLIQHDALRFMAVHRRLAGVFWRESRRQAPGRIEHFFAEMYARLDSIGMAANWTVPLPITQEELGDALGLSSVHTDRALKELRGRGLIEFDRGKLTVLAWSILVELESSIRPTFTSARRQGAARTARSRLLESSWLEA